MTRDDCDALAQNLFLSLWGCVPTPTQQGELAGALFAMYERGREDCRAQMTKECLKCRKVKPVGHFWADRTARDGLLRYCIECERSRVERWKAVIGKAAEVQVDIIREKLENDSGAGLPVAVLPREVAMQGHVELPPDADDEAMKAMMDKAREEMAKEWGVWTSAESPPPVEVSNVPPDADEPKIVGGE